MASRLKRYSYLLWFFIPYFIYACALLVIIILTDKGVLHLSMNEYHTPFLDTFFRYYTELGASIPFVIVAVFFFYKSSAALYILSSLVLNSLITNGLKRYFAEPRPTLYFENLYPDQVLPLVDGVRVYTHNGFPSGHTSATFALMICLTLITKRKDIAIISFLMAVLLGYSRVYLSQHFTEDVLFGSAVGLSTGLMLYSLYLIMDRTSWGRKPITGRR